MSRTETISLRLTKSERAALRQRAREEGKTLSEYVREAVGLEGSRKPTPRVPKKSVETRQKVSEWCISLLVAKPRRKKTRELRPFKTPYLRAPYAEGFEMAVRSVAQSIGSDDITVAYILAHLGEAIGNVVASGRMFRFPGLFAVGPYLISTETCGSYCVPRFQASQVWKEHVRWTCPTGAAQNRALKAHRRRRRPPKCYSTLDAVMENFRRAVINQEKHNWDAIGVWRDREPLLLA